MVVIKKMQIFRLLHLLTFIFLTTTLTKAERMSRPGCMGMCGEVNIPFPFGIGSNCSQSKWFSVDCNSSTPYLPALNNVELLDVEIPNRSVTVNVSMGNFDCENPVQNSSLVLSMECPFFISSDYNRLLVVGCGINADVRADETMVASCSSICLNETVIDINNCHGIGCCQDEIRYDLYKSFSLNRRLEREAGDGDCGSVFLMDIRYLEQVFDRGSFGTNKTYAPITLVWYSTFGRSSPECIICEEKGGYCEDNSHTDSGMSCYIYKKSKKGVILGVSISMGSLFLMAISYALYKLIKKTKAKRRKQRFFKRNGGLLLKQQQETDVGLVDKTILFTSKELEKATDNFNKNRILGQGAQGTVYKGMLVDGRILAVKKSQVVDESQLEQFINEVVILSQVNHRNVVKLLGFCLETEVPVLVSEFISNGTLYDFLHDESGEVSISLNMRLQIATEVAWAVSYLHSAASIPIYHRDIKTTNILLDEKYRAKVSDFGASKFIALDQTHLTTLVIGTSGYLDPEYFQSSRFTEKSDVYSFGVVLLELMTGEKPLSLTRFGENRSLATHFILAMEEGRVMSIFDAVVVKEGSRTELLVVANLAMRCLNINGKNRPTMKEVATELEGIKLSHMSCVDQINIKHGKAV